MVLPPFTSLLGQPSLTCKGCIEEKSKARTQTNTCGSAAGLRTKPAKPRPAKPTSSAPSPACRPHQYATPPRSHHSATSPRTHPPTTSPRAANAQHQTQSRAARRPPRPPPPATHPTPAAMGATPRRQSRHLGRRGAADARRQRRRQSVTCLAGAGWAGGRAALSAAGLAVLPRPAARARRR